MLREHHLCLGALLRDVCPSVWDAALFMPPCRQSFVDHLETLLCEEAVGDCHQCFWKVSAFFLLMHWSSLYSLDMDPPVVGL